MPATTAARSAHQLAGPDTRHVNPPQGIPTTQTFTAAAERLDAISDRVRLQILWWLTLDERSVTELCGLVGKRQQAVTHHLNILRLRADRRVPPAGTVEPLSPDPSGSRLDGGGPADHVGSVPGHRFSMIA